MSQSNSQAYKNLEEIDRIKKREKAVASNPDIICANDFDNIGYSFKDYARNPNYDLWLKVLFLIVTWERANPGKSFFMRYKTIARILNRYGVYCFDTAKRKDQGKAERYLKFGYCTVDGIISSIKTLVSMNLIKLEYADTKKREADNPNSWIFRKIHVNYKELRKYCCIYSEEEALKAFAPKSRERKLFYKSLVFCRAFVEESWKKASDAVKKRYMSAKQMMYSFIYKVSKKYFVYQRNRYFTKTPTSQIIIQDKEDQLALRWFSELDRKSRSVERKEKAEELNNIFNSLVRDFDKGLL